MSKLSKEELQAIIEHDLPGHKIVAEPDEPDEELAGSDMNLIDTRVEADTPDLASLRRKYLHKKYLAEEDAADELASSSASEGDLHENYSRDQDNTEIVLVESKNSADPLDRRPQVKAVIVDTKTKKIIGAQG